MKRTKDRPTRERLSEILRDLVLEETGLLFSAEKLAVESWEEVDGGLEIGDELRFENVTLHRLEEELENLSASVVCRRWNEVSPEPLVPPGALDLGDDEDFDDELEVEPLVPPGALDHMGRP